MRLWPEKNQCRWWQWQPLSSDRDRTQRVVELMTLLCNSHIKVSLGFLFIRFTLSLRPALVPQKFSFQLCLCVEQNFLRWLLQSFHSVGWHWSTTLCMTSMAWWAWAPNGFVCAPHLKLSLYFLLGYNVFQRCHRRTKLTLKKKKTFLLKDTSFQVKSLSKRLSWWAHIHARHCVALLRLKI